MFSGIVQDVGRVAASERRGGDLRLVIAPQRLKPLPDGVQAAYVQNSRNHVELGLSQWRQDYPAPSELLQGLLGCDSFVPDSDSSPNISGFCDRTTVQPLMQQAVTLGLTRPRHR